MARSVLNDGRWFEEDKAERFKEATRWDGNNHISCATGSQWDHQALFRTAGKIWILNSWSQWQGSADTYEEISDSEAAVWMVQNGHWDHPDAADQIDALEVK